MYTFKRPLQHQQKQQQQHQQDEEGEGEQQTLFYGNNNNNENAAEGMMTYATTPNEYGETNPYMATCALSDDVNLNDGQNHTNNNTGGGVIVEHESDVPTQSHYQQEEQQQQELPTGQISEEVPAEEVLRYCREMIIRRNITPPPQWRRMRVDLPTSVAELHLTPSAPETIQETHPITPSPCVVLQLDNCVPEGMTTKEYANSLVKYVMDLLAFQRASTAITSLRFVKIGTELSQLVLTFGRDVQLASLMLREFTKVNFRAGFGAPITGHTPNATFRVMDYHMTLHDGKGITAEDVAALLAPVRPPLSISVVAGYEPGLFYAAVKRPETVYAWLWNPFCSFVVQRTLFERCGVLVTMAECPHEFITRTGGGGGGNNNNNINNNSSSVPSAVLEEQQQQQQQQWQWQPPRSPWNNNGNANYNNNEGMVDSDGEGDDNYDNNGSSSGSSNFNGNDNDNEEINDGNNDLGRGDRQAKSGAPQWTRNAKEEIDIFGGLKHAEAQTARLDFVDDITELIHNVNLEKQQQQQQQEQEQEQEQQQRVYVGSSQSVLSFDHLTTETMLHTPFAQSTSLQQHQLPYPYYVGGMMTDVWQQQQEGRQPTFGPQEVSQYEMTPTVAGVYKPLQKPKIKYPELVDDNNNNNESALSEHVTNDKIVSQPAFTKDQQEAMCWNLGPCAVTSGGNTGGLYPTTSFAPYGMQSILPPMHLPMEPQPLNVGINAAPSIFGQPAYVTPFTNPGVALSNKGNGNNNSVGILASPSTPDVLLPQPVPITADRASELASKLVELTQLIFFTSKDNADLTVALKAGVLEKAEDSSLDALFHNVPCTATVPRMSVEMEDLMQFLEEQYLSIKEVIGNSAPDIQESRRLIVTALLSCRSTLNDDEKNDWVQQEEGGADTEGIKTLQLPALLPYLLTTIEGTEIVSAIASHDTVLILPLLTRYVLPFLMDASVVQSVCTVALRVMPTAENPLVQRIIRHWGPLTAWLHTYIQCQATSAEIRAEGGIEQTSATSQSLKSTTKSSVVRRLTSQVGNTMDMLLASISDEQRAAIKAYLDVTNPLDAFKKGVQAVEQEETLSNEKQPQEQKAAILHVSTHFLWSSDGAVHRSLLRLYLNANLFNGSEVVDVLFASQPFLTREHYYFLLIAFSRSLVSPVLSDETARACGAFLRLMEQKQLNSDDGNKSAYVLTQKDADHLLDTAMRALGSLEAYTCLRDAYFVAPSPVNRYERVETKLSRTTPHLTLSSTSQQQQQQHQHQQETDRTRSGSEGRWQAEWTAAMRNYPQIGEPFTPLPTGWTTALSRSYGHYYFKNPKGAATYKHPTDASEFMASPQAFLREPGVSITLADVLAFVNSKSKTTETVEKNKEKEAGTTAPVKVDGSTSAPMEEDAIITEELAEKWLQDQRIRVEVLDMAILELLKITYRVGSSAGRRSGQGRSRKSSRHRRESSERRRHHSRRRRQNSHASRKRPRDTPSSAAELQRKLVKVGSYPVRGHPFPPLPRGWTCNLSSSNGLYYFRPPRGNPIYQHPLSRCEYRASPQAFILHRGIHVNALATAANKTVEEVEKWLGDQRQRDEVLDAAAVRIVPIEYAPCPDYDQEDIRSDSQRKQEHEGSSSHRSTTPHRSHGKK